MDERTLLKKPQIIEIYYPAMCVSLCYSILSNEFKIIALTAVGDQRGAIDLTKRSKHSLSSFSKSPKHEKLASAGWSCGLDEVFNRDGKWLNP